MTKTMFQHLYGKRQLIPTLYPVSDCHHCDASDGVPLPGSRAERPEGCGADLGRRRPEWVPRHGQVPASLHPGTTSPGTRGWILRLRWLRSLLEGRLSHLLAVISF